MRHDFIVFFGINTSPILPQLFLSRTPPPAPLPPRAPPERPLRLAPSKQRNKPPPRKSQPADAVVGCARGSSENRPRVADESRSATANRFISCPRPDPGSWRDALALSVSQAGELGRRGAAQPQPGLSASHLGAKPAPGPLRSVAPRALSRLALPKIGTGGVEACGSVLKPEPVAGRGASHGPLKTRFFGSRAKSPPPQKKKRKKRAGGSTDASFGAAAPGAAISEEIFRKSAKNA